MLHTVDYYLDPYNNYCNKETEYVYYSVTVNKRNVARTNSLELFCSKIQLGIVIA